MVDLILEKTFNFLIEMFLFDFSKKKILPHTVEKWRKNSTFYVCVYVYYIDSPKGCTFFWKVLSFYTYYALSVPPYQPVPVRFSGPELVAPHLESALDEQL